MASLCKDANGNKRIIFVDTDGKRKPIRLGKMPMEAARQIKTKVEHLVGAKTSRCAWNAETALWVSELDTVLADKLAAVGLIPRRNAPESKRANTHLGDFVKSYIAGREADAKPNTLSNLRQAERFLIQFLESEKLIREVTPGDADEYRRWLADKVGDNTARRHLGRAKQFFRAALRKRLIVENPFGDMKGLSVRENKSREFFVSREDAEKVLSACPDSQWRLLFALARYAGLRTPSEPLALTWGDVDWEQSKLRVPGVKTAERFVPLFPELRPHLEQAWDEAAPGATFIITRYRDRNSNLRTQLERIIRKAGLKPWGKPFQNLRSTRETELVNDGYDIRDACDWLGNSPSIALRHYLQRSDAGFKRATGESEAARIQARNPAQQPTAEASTTSHELKEPRESRVFAHLCDEVQSGQYPRQESNL